MTNYATLADLKTWGAYDDSRDDTQLGWALTAASRSIDGWCGRKFTTDTSATARTFFCAHAWTLDVDDFYDTASLIVKTDTGDNGTFDQTWTVTRDFVVYPTNGELNGLPVPYYKIEATGSRYFPRSALGSGRRPRAQITAKWGWSSVPDDVFTATLIKAARLARRKDIPESSGGMNGGGFAMPLVKVSVREDPDVCALLAPYRKMAGGGMVMI